MRKVLNAGLLLLGIVSAFAQTPIKFELKDAKFGLNSRPFKNVEAASCPQDASSFANACPADYDCRKTNNFRVASTGKGLGVSDLRRFYVVPLGHAEEMRCWSADLDYQPSHNHSAVGSAQFTVSKGGVPETGELPIFVEGAAPALVLNEFCKSWTLGLGSPGSCKLSVVWQHAEHGGNLLGCAWSDASRTLDHIDGCVSQGDTAAFESLTRSPRPARDNWRNLSKGKTADIELQSKVPWSKWREAFQDPMEERPRAVAVTAYYRLSAGGPVLTQDFPVPFQVASPWYLLLGCLFIGSTVGSALPLAAAFAQKKTVKLGAWLRASIALAAYGAAIWIVLYIVQGRVGLMQTELRLNQAIPVLLFGLFVGFRGLGFVIEWIEKLLTPNAGRATAILLAVCGLAGMVDAASLAPSGPKQLFVADGRLLVVTSLGVFPLEQAPPAYAQQQQMQKYSKEPVALIPFAQGAVAGGAASGLVQIPGGKSREVIFVSLVLSGGQIIIDEYMADGSQNDNRMINLRQSPLDFTAAPTAMIWDADAQRLYAASPRGTVWSFSRSGPPQKLTSCNARISSFALDPAGRRLFAGDVRQARVLVLDLNVPATGFVAFANDAPLANPESLAFDRASSRLFVADEHRDAVFSIKVPPPPSRPLNLKWSTFVSKNYTYLRNFDFGDPVGLAIRGTDLWIADRQARRAFPVDLKSGAQKVPLTLP